MYNRCIPLEYRTYNVTIHKKKFIQKLSLSPANIFFSLSSSDLQVLKATTLSNVDLHVTKPVSSTKRY